MALLVSKVPFWERASKGGFTICETQKLCSAENAVFIVLSAKHNFAEIKECKLKNLNLPKLGGCLPTCKREFLFVCFWLFCFLFPVFLVFFVWKKSSKKAIFLPFSSSFLF